MASLLTSWVVHAISLLVSGIVLPGIHVGSTSTAVYAALVLGILNYTVKPCFQFFTFPCAMFTFGLFSWVINAVTLCLVSFFTPGFYVETYLDALLGSIILHLCSNFLYSVIDYSNKKLASS